MFEESKDLPKQGEIWLVKFEKLYPFEILISFQGKRGKALPDQIKTYSHSRIIKKLGTLNPKHYPEVEGKLKEVFGWKTS